MLIRKEITIATIALRQLLRRVSALRQLLQLLRRWTAPAIATIASMDCASYCNYCVYCGNVDVSTWNFMENMLPFTTGGVLFCFGDFFFGEQICFDCNVRGDSVNVAASGQHEKLHTKTNRRTHTEEHKTNQA